MFALLSSLMNLFQAAEPARARDEAYLSDSIDMADLERRMRQLDAREDSRYAGGAVFRIGR